MSTTEYTLTVELVSDATFGRGAGVPGLVDVEVEHDPETGLPFLRGKTLRGLLVEECANLLYGLRTADRNAYRAAGQAARALFGKPGSREADTGALSVGAATFPPDFANAVRDAVRRRDVGLHAAEVLEALTTIRRQTAIDPDTGSAEDSTLRARRAVVRGIEWQASLRVDHAADPQAKATERALLAACAATVRRGGLGRNRGAGKLRCRLFENGSEVPAGALLGGAPA